MSYFVNNENNIIFPYTIGQCQYDSKGFQTAGETYPIILIYFVRNVMLS